VTLAGRDRVYSAETIAIAEQAITRADAGIMTLTAQLIGHKAGCTCMSCHRLRQMYENRSHIQSIIDAVKR
jgi:hypothetical protein